MKKNKILISSLLVPLLIALPDRRVLAARISENFQDKNGEFASRFDHDDEASSATGDTGDYDDPEPDPDPNIESDDPDNPDEETDDSQDTDNLRSTPSNPNSPTSDPTGSMNAMCGGPGSADNPDADSSVGGDDSVSDPVKPSTSSSTFKSTDVVLKNSLGRITFNHWFDSNNVEAAVDSISGAPGETFLPKPYGSDPTNAYSLKWAHKYYSFVLPTGWVSGTSIWAVRSPSGRTLEFVACSNGATSCWATTASSGMDSAAKLYWTNTGGSTGYFTLYLHDRRLTYSTLWDPVGANPRYFLTKADSGIYPVSGGTPRTLYTISYQAPAGLTCPGTASSGAPYISSITTTDGNQITLGYVSMTSTNGVVSSECVISTVNLVQTRGVPSSATVVTKYTYSASQAGLLSSTEWSETSPTRKEVFSYVDGASNPGFASGFSNGYPTVTTLASNQVTAVQGHYVNTTFDAPVSVSCWSGYNASYCISQTSKKMRDNVAHLGDKDGTAITNSRNYQAQNTNFARSPRVAGIVDPACGTANCYASTPPGTAQWAWIALPNGVIANRGFGDKKGNWHIMSYGLAGITPGFTKPAERRVEMTGVLYPDDGGGAFSTVNTTYSYGGSSQTPVGYEQHISSSSNVSVVPSCLYGSTVRYSNRDPSTNFIKSKVQDGCTQTYSVGSNAWANAIRTVGTFYSQKTICSGVGTPDPLGRVIEVHGPCLVSNHFSADCDQSGTVPVTQYTYYPSGTTNDSNKIHTVTRFTAATVSGGVVSCSGASLVMTFSNYDARGNPGKVIDENGITKTYTYVEDKVATDTKVGSTTTTTAYAYENGILVSITYPQGNKEVFCYHEGSTGLDCKDGVFSPRLQWKAKVDSTGTSFSEKVYYTYWSDGDVRSETSTTPTETRQIRLYAADAHHRPTYIALGNGVAQKVMLYDPDNELTGVSLPFNNAPTLCGGANTDGSPVSPLCAALSYNRANLVSGADVPVDVSTESRTCFTYNSSGAVTSARSGCPTTSTPGDCSACTTPLSQYQFDDFGNLISAVIPGTDNGAGALGTTHYESNATHQLVKKQTPGMVDASSNPEWLQYAYDGLGRVTDAWREYSVSGTASSELLYHYDYDQSLSVGSTGCPNPASSYVNGHVQRVVDSFGQTWFTYNDQGNKTAEWRVRTGSSNCSATQSHINPNTFYTYSPNGSMTSVVYPYGRTITYNYPVATAANADRVQSISVQRYVGGDVTNATVISGVAWEPYAGLRGYQINHPVTGTSGVEYFLGDNAIPDTGTCPFSVPSTNDYTGRTRDLWVYSGTFVPGTPKPANIYSQRYTWTADQLSRQDTCLLSQATARTESYGYDRLSRLNTASGSMSAAGGGSFSSRSYTYDLRGNVTQTGADTLPVKYYAYQTAPLSDRLASQKNCSGSCPATPLEYLYSFNHDGTISSKVSANDSSGTPALGYQFAPGPGSGGGGLDMVFHSVSVNGAAYNYFYDARNRRRYKSYPAGVSDEFFYSPRNFMLVDQGNSSVTTPTYYTDDDYVWLDGHPVVLVHGQLSTAWVRQSDTTTSCGRNGDVGECGFYFPVSDYAKKPVVMLNSSQLVTGVGEYEPLGQANRVEMDSETAHPYTTTQTGFGTFTPGSIGGTTSQLRVKFQMIDTQLRTFGCSGSPDRVDLVDQSTSSILATQDGRSPWWSPWVSPASISGVRADLVVNNPQIQTCLPTCICVAHSNTIRKGASIESYEYRRVQTGATAFWTPIRFQGQYHDEETDLNQNWNRFYEPLTGRYLEPEPMLALGEYLVDVAKVAGQVSVYGYASNDPVSHGDPTGHQVCGNRPGSIIEQTKDDCDRLVDQMTGALNSKIVDMMKVLATTIAQATMGPEDFCAMYHQAIYDQAMYADSLPQGCDKAKAYYDLTEIVLEAESVGCFKNFKPPPGSNSSGNLP